MDTKNRNEKRCTAKISTYKRGRRHPTRQAEKSHSLQEPKIEKESPTCRNTQETKKKVKSIYGPVKEQLQVLIEYINILEKKPTPECVVEITFFLKFFDNIKRQCEIYLNCQAMKLGKNG